jgi:uncharacterized protein
MGLDQTCVRPEEDPVDSAGLSRSLCSECGVCCMHMAVPPFMPHELPAFRKEHPKVFEDFLAVVETRRLQFRAFQSDAIPCGFFDPITRQCRHNHAKPEICAVFEIEGDGCNNNRTNAGLPEIFSCEVFEDPTVVLTD